MLNTNSIINVCSVQIFTLVGIKAFSYPLLGICSVSDIPLKFINVVVVCMLLNDCVSTVMVV